MNAGMTDFLKVKGASFLSPSRKKKKKHNILYQFIIFILVTLFSVAISFFYLPANLT